MSRAGYSSVQSDMQWVRRCKQEEGTLVDSIHEMENLDEEKKRLYELFMKQKKSSMPKGPLSQQREQSDMMPDAQSYKSQSKSGAPSHVSKAASQVSKVASQARSQVSKRIEEEEKQAEDKSQVSRVSKVSKVSVPKSQVSRISKPAS